MTDLTNQTPPDPAQRAASLRLMARIVRLAGVFFLVLAAAIYAFKDKLGAYQIDAGTASLISLAFLILGLADIFLIPKILNRRAL